MVIRILRCSNLVWVNLFHLCPEEVSEQGGMFTLPVFTLNSSDCKVTDAPFFWKVAVQMGSPLPHPLRFHSQWAIAFAFALVIVSFDVLHYSMWIAP